MKFEALFLGRMESSFKDKESGALIPYYNVSVIPPSGESLPILLKASEDGFKAYEGVKPLSKVAVIFTVSKDGNMRVIG